MFRGDKAPPIVLRSLEGYHEDQYATYKLRAMYEEKFYGEHVEYPANKGKKKSKAK